MKTCQRCFIIGLAVLFAGVHQAAAQGTAFTYQGRLNNGTNPATGSYDLTFALFSVSSGGSAVAGPLTNSPTGVTNGLFMVTLDFGASFPGADRWLEIALRTNGGGAFTNLSPRQKLTAVPYAITASNLSGTVSATGLSGTYSSAVTFNNAANSFTGSGAGLTSLNASSLASGTIPGARLSGTYSNPVTFNNAGNSFSGTFSGSGSGLSGVNAASLGGFTAGQFWKLAGNGGTTPGIDFVGTTDNNALELKVNSQRAFRLEPDLTSPNLIGGHPNNSVLPGLFGATIGGGGDTLDPNSAQGNFAVIGGGSGNQAADYATVSGGTSNLAVGPFSVIGGGAGNFAALSATASGGTNNSAFGLSSAIGGGVSNRAAGIFSTIAGGFRNSALGSQSVVSGGSSNQAFGPFSVVSGGGTNLASGISSVAGGGSLNRAVNTFATASGGSNNLASGYASTVSGGEGNQATQLDATVGGGTGNKSWSFYTTVGGGYFNLAAVVGDTVGGGAVNTAAGGYATVGGGLQNLATNLYATVGGGLGNVAGATNSTIGGGATNFATGQYSTIPGGAGASVTQFGQLANASGAFAAPGDAQHSMFILRAITAANLFSPTNLTLDGSTNAIYLQITTNRTMTFHFLITARADQSVPPFTPDSAGYEIKGVVKETGGSATFVGGTPVTTLLGSDPPAFSWSAVVTNIGNAITVMASSSGNPAPVRWVARVDTAEVSW